MDELKFNAIILNTILQDELIKPVYQPIVSLSTGDILGFESLSRITDLDLEIGLDVLFSTADSEGKAWELESLCRRKAINGARLLGENQKLFLNINPNIIHDEKFRKGFTIEKLLELGMNPRNIIFEITERVAAIDNLGFLESIAHYKEQNYDIAIDDMGSGYSGLNKIVAVKPHYIKMDMALVRNIHIDEMKILIAKAMADFCKKANIKIIAEGIETREELEKLIELGFDYGQGYFLARPKEKMEAIGEDKRLMVQECFSNTKNITCRKSLFPKIETVCRPAKTFDVSTTVENIMEVIKLTDINEFCVTEEDRIVGFMSKADLLSHFSGMFGYSLNYKKSIKTIMGTDFLKVDSDMCVREVSKLAMNRSYENLYNPIIIEKNGSFFGIATVKDLLETSTAVELENAKHCNPLTGLPGNVLIEKEISSILFTRKPFSIIYFDLDNFKAFNDSYGFDQGDIMLSLVCEVLFEVARKGEFIGHIGGDDFIMICDYHNCEKLCREVIYLFSKKVKALYNFEDLQNGFITSISRHGLVENYPIATLSIAAITNKYLRFENYSDFSLEITKLKKKCKQVKGNYCEIV